MREYPLTELGYFSDKDCKKIADIMYGKSFMKFDVGYSNYAGNCTLIVKTDYDESEEEIKNMFLHCVLSELARR